MSLRRESLSSVRLWAASAGVLLACGGPAEPGDDTTAEQTTSASTSASSTQGGSSTQGSATDSGTEASDESGPPECTVANYNCPAGFGCSQPNNYDPPFCEPIPEGGCTQVEPCPEGFMCMSGSHHTEIGSCEPIDESTGSTGGSTGEGTGSSGGSTTAG